MLRLNLTPADVVHVCLLVADARLIVVGSIETTCAECDAAILRAPGPPAGKVSDEGVIEPVRGITPPPNVLLCIPCARMHMQLAGMRLG
jgi:hypothetical protein